MEEISNLIIHNNHDISFVIRNCTFYAMAYDEGQIGRIVSSNMSKGHPIGYALHLFNRNLYLEKYDKILISNNSFLISKPPLLEKYNGLSTSFNCYDMTEEEISTSELSDSMISHFKKIAENFIDTNILFHGDRLSLTTFYGSPVLWINHENPDTRFLPHMEFVGGHPDEWCIFVKNLTKEDVPYLKYWNHEPVKLSDLKNYFKKDN